MGGYIQHKYTPLCLILSECGQRLQPFPYLVRAKLGVIQITDGVVHVFFAYKLHHSSAITEHISITYITCLSHVILQVLPASTGR